MKFRTVTRIPENIGFITHNDELMTVGSCFADNVGDLLSESGFDILPNPFGILFNPVSIEKNIRSAIDGKLDEVLLLERNGGFYHYDYPSTIKGRSPEELRSKINQLQADFRQKLENTNRLILTFGTAWVYRFRQTNDIVANCHKVPQSNFSRELLDLEALKQAYAVLLEDLRKNHPKLEILLTVSPVRHIKNGLRGNNVSKAVLHLLTDFLVSKFDFVHYFPAYELVVDDLRDYRFYNEDMIHPGTQAITYVFERFSEVYFSNQTQEIVQLAFKLSRLKGHSFMAPSPADIERRNQQIKDLETRIQALKRKA